MNFWACFLFLIAFGIVIDNVAVGLFLAILLWLLLPEEKARN